MLRIALLLAIEIVIVGVSSRAQNATPAIATIQGLRLYQAADGPAVEIVANHPVEPIITKLDGPPRLVVDLPYAIVSLARKRFAFQSEQISAVRCDQYQRNPPVARVVVDLLAPADYTSEAAGNRLTIRLHPPGTAAKPASPPGPAPVVQPAVVPVTSGSSHIVTLAADRIAAGSAITAGSDTTILRLGRGGEVHVCPGTTVSVTSSQDGNDLMLGMSSGAMEGHYSLETSADSLLTPDFRIVLSGPGEFHYAMSTDSRGNTCVQTLPGNKSPLVVSELLGDGTYQVMANEQVTFRSGRLDLRDTDTPMNCGCPPARPEVLRASAEPPQQAVPDVSGASLHLAQGGEQSRPVTRPPDQTSDPQHKESGQGIVPGSQVAATVLQPDAAHSETAPLPAPKPNDVHVQVEAPFVFRASDPPPPPAAPIREVAELPLAHYDPPGLPAIIALPPPDALKGHQQRHGLFGKLRGFFSSMFH
jgi:hypothetical protein